MVYRNNTGRLGFWLHQCVLRNTLAGSKTVVSTSRNPTVSNFWFIFKSWFFPLFQMITLHYQKFMKGGARRQSALARRRYAALGLSLRSRDVPLYKIFFNCYGFFIFSDSGRLFSSLRCWERKEAWPGPGHASSHSLWGPGHAIDSLSYRWILLYTPLNVGILIYTSLNLEIGWSTPPPRATWVSFAHRTWVNHSVSFPVLVSFLFVKLFVRHKQAGRLIAIDNLSLV